MSAQNKRNKRWRLGEAYLLGVLTMAAFAGEECPRNEAIDALFVEERLPGGAMRAFKQLARAGLIRMELTEQWRTVQIHPLQQAWGLTSSFSRKRRGSRIMFRRW